MPAWFLATALLLAPAEPPPAGSQAAPGGTALPKVEKPWLLSPGLWRGARPNTEGFRVDLPHPWLLQQDGEAVKPASAPPAR